MGQIRETSNGNLELEIGQLEMEIYSFRLPYNFFKRFRLSQSIEKKEEEWWLEYRVRRKL